VEGYEGMEEVISSKLIEKKSRFFAHLYGIDDPDEIKDIIKCHRKLYRKANHHCWALRVHEKDINGERSMGVGGEKIITDFKNDGEVGHPGKVLLELLTKYDAVGYALVVSRVFGGIKLGVGGVSRAFREVGEEILVQWKDSIGVVDPLKNA